MAVHAFPQLKNPASFEYSIRKVSMKDDMLVDLGQRMMLAKLQEGETLELTIKSSKGQSTTASFLIVYSPFSDRDRQACFIVCAK